MTFNPRVTVIWRISQFLNKLENFRELGIM